MAENVKDLHIIKRSGAEVPFDGQKIINAIKGANKEVDSVNRVSENDIESIESKIHADLMELPYEVDVEQIQDMVELGLMKHDAYKVAQKYIRYRYEHELQRSGSNLDAGILALIDFESETIKQENSNKNPMINSTQRDYMAGEVSKDITVRKLLPRDIVEAHNEGIIHFHDSDYFAQHMTNCTVFNLEDMLQNGTMISETLIEKPKSFSVACNVATQIIAQVASNQYGGQTFSLAHLAPFVDVSRKKIREKVIKERTENGESLDDEIIDKITEVRLRDEVKDGVQTIQYQILTLLTTNGLFGELAVVKLRELFCSRGVSY